MLWFWAMGVRRGGQEGALDPPWPTKIVCFLHFFDKKSIFLGVFGADSMFLPPPPAPLENFALP